MKMKEILKHDETFRYQLLNRLRSDCDYYLNGNRSKKYLWAGDEKDQINAMKQLWKSFPSSETPEWLTWNDILDYEDKFNNNLI